MRILKGYSKEIQKDFESLKNTHCPLYRIYQNRFDDLPRLRGLVCVIQNESEDKQLLQDIADYVNDKAEFDEPKYYVRFADDFKYAYLNLRRESNALIVDSIGNTNKCQTQFTMQEIKNLGEKYVPFAVPVSEVND